jgi:hypothetical protein
VHVGFQRARLLLDALERRVIPLALAELQQLAGVGEAARDRGERLDRALQGFLLAPELLGALGIGPDLRVLELPEDLGQPRLPGVDVKGTSSARATDA